jgi:hypothetical protein
MRELQEQQREIVDRAQQADGMHQSPSMENQTALEETQQELGTRKDKLAENFVTMMDDASELAERGAQTQESMSRRLGDWMRETSREGIYEDIQETRPLVDYGIWDRALSEERKIGEKFDRAAEHLQSVADALVKNDLEGMQKALEHLDRLLQREEVARALESREPQAGPGAAEEPGAGEPAQSPGGAPQDQAEQATAGAGAGEEKQEQAGPAAGEAAQESQAPSPGEGQRDGAEPGPQQGTQDGAAESAGGTRAPAAGSDQGGARGADGSWPGVDVAMRDFIERGYEDWLNELNDAESLLPQGTPIRTNVTRLRERIEMMRREWRARALAPQFDLFLEHAAAPLAETAGELQREISRQLDAQEFLAVDEGSVPERYRERVADYFKRLSEAEGRP